MRLSPSQSALILVVEDDPTSRITLEKVLLKGGYRVITAANGRLGFNAYCDQHPDLVLMDALMPEMNGYEAIAAIRNYHDQFSVPILMLTALDDMESIDQAFDVGATDFITKPLNWQLLSQRVKYALRGARMEMDLRTSQARLAFTQKLAKLGYWEWDAVNDEVTGSQATFDLFCVPNHPGMTFKHFTSHILPKDQNIIQQALNEADNGQNTLQVSFRVLEPNGDLSHIECLGEVSYDANDKIAKIVGSAQDISRLHKAESLIEYQAQYDTLTDLPNRSSFNDAVKDFIRQHNNKIGAVIVFDIDRFKQFNETLGQEGGDNLLSALAQRLNRIAREGDFVARLGSDEFALFVRNLKHSEELNLLINRFKKDLLAPFKVHNQEFFLGYSGGISVFPTDSDSPGELFNLANLARTNSKRHGGSQFTFYQASMNDDAEDLLTLENDLRQALKKQEITVFYQPQVDVKTLKPVGAEALVRWQHPKRGLISPGVFIPLAESIGLINEIGDFVLKTALFEAAKWHRDGFTNLRIGINLSGKQLTQNNFIDFARKTLQAAQIEAKFVDLEITESIAMTNADENIRVLHGLKSLGVALSIDDFGTGYSSLAYLHSFPIDTLKIDRSFVINLATQEGQAIATTILAMAESLKLEVVAEGIEEPEQAAFFMGKHCHIFQGFKYGKPMPANEFNNWLKNQ